MRHIFHEIFERYLNSEQSAFDTSLRELWASERLVFRPRSKGNGTAPTEEPARNGAVYGERESRN